MFYADGNIEIIEDVEALEDGFKACRLLGGCCFVKADSDETGGGVTSPGRPKNPDPAPKAVSVRLLRAWGATPPGKRFM